MPALINFLIISALAFSGDAKSYQSTPEGQKQYKLRYELRAMYMNCPSREVVRQDLIDHGGDLDRRVTKWDYKLAINQFTLDPTKAVSRETLFEKAREYVTFFESEEHQKVLEATMVKKLGYRFLVDMIHAFEQGRTGTEIEKELKANGFDEKDLGDERVFGRVSNWDKQWQAGNYDYFKGVEKDVQETTAESR